MAPAIENNSTAIIETDNESNLVHYPSITKPSDVWEFACADIVRLTAEIGRNVLAIAGAVRQAKRAYLAMHPGDSSLNFAKAMAEETGLHPIWINRQIQISEGLDPISLQSVMGTAITGDQGLLLGLVQADSIQVRAAAIAAFKEEEAKPLDNERKTKPQRTEKAKKAARKVLAANPSTKQKKAADKKAAKAKAADKKNEQPSSSDVAESRSEPETSPAMAGDDRFGDPDTTLKLKADVPVEVVLHGARWTFCSPVDIEVKAWRTAKKKPAVKPKECTVLSDEDIEAGARARAALATLRDEPPAMTNTNATHVATSRTDVAAELDGPTELRAKGNRGRARGSKDKSNVGGAPSEPTPEPELMLAKSNIDIVTDIARGSSSTAE